MVLTISSLKGLQGALRFSQLQKSRDLLIQANQKLEKEIKTINYEIEKIDKSKAYVRKQLKDRYHLTEKGEHIIFFAN